MDRWKTHLIAHQRVNCRKHEQRHFKRILIHRYNFCIISDRGSFINQILLALRIVTLRIFDPFFFCFVIPVVILKSNVCESGIKSRRQDTKRKCATYEWLLDVRWRSSRSWPTLQICMCSMVRRLYSRITTKHVKNMSVLDVVSCPFHVTDDYLCSFIISCPSLFRFVHLSFTNYIQRP